MKKKIFSIAIALLLLLSFSLVAAVPAVAVCDYDGELILEDKAWGTDWSIVANTTVGVLKYCKAGETFCYNLTATDLAASTPYSLIYYADKEERYMYWGGDNPGAVIGQFTTDAGGEIGPVGGVDGEVDLGMNLPCPPDANMYDVDYCVTDSYDHCHGAKIWLIPTTALTSDSILPVDVWPPDTGGVWLFETDLITYTDTSAPPAGSGTIIIEKETIPVGAPDEFGFELWGTTIPGSPIGDGEQLVIEDLPPGTYPVNEILPPGWYLVDVMFDDADSYWDDPDTDLDTAFFVVGPCETVTGTFLNCGGLVTVDIIECPGCTDCQEPEHDVPVSTTFTIKVEITNVMDFPIGHGDCSVEAEIDWESKGGTVELWPAGSKDHERLGILDPGETNTVGWTFHCTGPGDVKFWVDTNWGGYDECMVHQMVEPGLEVEVIAPCEVCVDCEPVDYVDAIIRNTGDCDVTNVTAILTRTGPATIKPSASKDIGTIPAGTSVTVSEVPSALGPWEFTCTGENSVTWTVKVNGIDECTGEPLYEEGSWEDDTAITEQVETTVDVCVIPLSTTPNPYWGIYGEQLYLGACDAVCGFIPEDRPDSATVSYDPCGLHNQRFQVSAYVNNCADTPVAKIMDVTLGEALLFNSDGTVHFGGGAKDPTDYWQYGGVCDPDGTFISGDETSQTGDERLSWRIDVNELVYCYALDPPGPQREALHEPPFPVTVNGPGEPGTIRVDQVCPCCTAVVTWVVECVGEDCCDLEPDTIEVTVQEVEPDDTNAPWSNLPCNPAYIHQEPKAHLTTEMQAYVPGCDGCPVLVDTVSVSQDYDVLLTIANIGVADAEDVVVSGNVYGPVSCDGESFADFDVGLLKGGETKSYWFSDLMGCYPHCEGEGTVTFQIHGLEGYDENTCELIDGDNIELDCPLYIEQCDIHVEIINPVDCTDICTGDEFAVKAKLSNCGDCNFEDVKFYLSWIGPGMVMIEDGPMKALKDLVALDPGDGDCTYECGLDAWDVVAPCDDCFDCTEYEMSWQVRCIKPGDVTFDVCVTTDEDWTPEESMAECDAPGDCDTTLPGTYDDLDPVPHLVIQSINNPTVHQQPRPDIALEIISPENIDTFVGTGQEFAITVAIANKTDWICDGNSQNHGISEGIGMYREAYPVTVTDLGLIMHPMHATILDGPVGPIELDPDEVKNVTFTLQCTKSGLITIDAWAIAETGYVTAPCCPPLHAFSPPLLLWQYPAAHLDVVIDSVDPGTTIPACEEFTINYTITNTGEADATEVDAILSVTPDGSARPIEGINSGYTKFVGTIPGHGQGEPYVGEWTLHCKEACESTINITASGFDENGWHKKQVCQSTGNFIIEDGAAIIMQTGEGDRLYALDGMGVDTGVIAAVLIGETSGLIGPFNLTVPITINGQDHGDMTVMGAVNTDMDYTSLASHVNLLTSIFDDSCASLLELLEWLNLQGVNKDVMIWFGELTMDPTMDLVDGDFPDGCFCASAGLIQVINGGFNGIGFSLSCCEGLDAMTFTNGLYCSTMAQEALRPIEGKFIEDASVTMKQLPSAGLDLGIIKTVDESTPAMGETIDYTIVVTNYGPGQATGVEVTDDLWDTAVTYDSHVASQGSYDDTTGVWTVGSLTVGASASLTLSASVAAETEFINTATVSCDQPDGNPRNNTDSAIINRDLAIMLESEWNFVSWPLIPGSGDPGDADIDPEGTGILQDLTPLTTNVISVWGNYDPTTYSWDSYIPGAVTQTLTEMWDGVAFWINMNTGGMAITIDGQEQPDPPSPPRVYDVVGGSGGYWNAIGFKSTAPRSPEIYLAGIEGDYTIIYGYDEGEYFLVGTPGNMMLEPGLAYYIAVLESGKIFP